ncbi:hypothetical protein [Tissierella sp. Yu-01]|uniref:hypothetical protein n=1 Tax=Tissierella sp. Yu-01 TaxID=3035694 RepID=UPI00240DEEFC|nr:hypothetical protein [Tissierella sp. Yu-01]WFA09329.1 hypothetical protein P3962_01780 [Tissierella sp. Yu-01]
MHNIQVLFIVLNEVDYLNDILAGFVDIGVSGATVLDSQGMASVLVNGSNQGVPLFGYLKTLLEDSLPYNKTIFTVLQSEELVEKAVAVVQEVVGEISSPNVGFMFTIPIGKTYSMNLS